MKKMQTAVIVAVTMLCALASFGQNTNAPRFLKTTKAGADVPVVLDWASDPLTMYRIEYSTTLSNDWKIAQENIAPQGTNTVWADVGDEVVTNPRLSSSDSDVAHRFYRVAVERYMSNTSPITVGIGNVSEGAELSGTLNVSASASAAQSVGTGTLLIDGEQVSQASGSSYSLPLDTRTFPNGPHRLSVIAEDTGDDGTTGGDEPVNHLGASYGAKSVMVTFNNFLSNLRLRYTAFRPDWGQVQEITGLWAEPRQWQVAITGGHHSTR